MQKRDFGPRCYRLSQRSDEFGCGTVSSIRRFHAHRADLRKPVEAHALAGHGDQRALPTNSDVVAQLNSPRTEGPRLGHVRKREHLGTIGDPKGHDRSARLCRTSANVLKTIWSMEARRTTENADGG